MPTYEKCLVKTGAALLEIEAIPSLSENVPMFGSVT